MIVPLEVVFHVAAAAMVVVPALAFFAIASFAAVGAAPSEKFTARVVQASLTSACLLAILVMIGFAIVPADHLEISYGSWFVAGTHEFKIAILLDRLSVTFALLTTILCGLIGVFSVRYLHRDPGYTRFFLLLLLFCIGMLLICLGGSIDVLFAGWELLGLTSMLLIAFFNGRVAPARNALRAFVTYRICDVGLLVAAVLLHHHAGTTEFSELFVGGAWPDLQTVVPFEYATVVGLLLVFAAMGKSAQVPFSGWLPRAMEGPTPSSAIFYGALSIHAGAYLLLRAGPILAAAPLARAMLIAVGLTTALHATFVGRAQSDAKSSLAYASMSQAGLILAEIGLGLRLLVLLHIVGHACVRTLQLLRAPSLIHDLHQLEAVAGHHLPPRGVHYERLLPARFRRWLYRCALERGYLEPVLDRFVVSPVWSLFRSFDRLERHLTLWLGGAHFVFRRRTSDGSAEIDRQPPRSEGQPEEGQ